MDTFHSDQWIGQFCVHLMKHRPDMDFRMAVHEAVAVYPVAANLSPEDAARLLAAGLPPLEPRPIWPRRTQE
jgi:hypothetical protein